MPAPVLATSNMAAAARSKTPQTGGITHYLTGVVVHSPRAFCGWRMNKLQFPESCQSRVTMTAELQERGACWEMEFVGGVVRRQMSRWGVAIKM